MTWRWMIGGVLAVVFAAGGAVGARQQQATTRREPQFENADVQVWKSIIMPNQPLSLHRHDFGRTIVALKGGTLDIVNAQGETVKRLTWETGKAYWLDKDPAGEQHGDLNRGTQSIEVIVVQQRR